MKPAYGGPDQPLVRITAILRSKMPANLFDTEAKEAYLSLIREGFMRFEAARRLGFTLSTVKKHYAADPEFKEALDEAQLEATEPVEKVLYDAALNKEPWAVTKWLTKRDKDRWGEEPAEVNIKVNHELGPGLAAVQILILELEKRRALREAESGALLKLSASAPPIDVDYEEIKPDTVPARPGRLIRKAPPV